jgi:ABC-type dipeptide/oligopeptide/nickel transport system permease component
MTRFLAVRLTSFVPVVVGVSILVFLMLHLVPGDPVSALVGDAPVSAADRERLREQYGLNDPLYVQYGRFVVNALQGDLGRSLRSKRPVIDEIADQFPQTIELALAAIAFAVVLGVTLGVIAATHHQTWIDTLCSVISLLSVSMPSFWLGLMLIFTFALGLGWLPATGQGGIERLVLPALTLGWFAAAIIARLVRSSMLEVLRQEYVNTARAKGLRESVVIYRHALRNALIPTITMVGIQFGTLLGGAVIVETVFARQGLGRLIVTGILQKDFPVVQGGVLITALVYVVANFLVDLAYAALDPRIRVGS